MPYDANLILQSQTTVSASTNGATLDLLTSPGTPRRGLVARVRVTSATAATTGATVTFNLQQSTDGTAWTNLISSDPITPGTYSADVPEISLPFVQTKEYLRLVSTFSATTGNPVVAYASEVGVSWPG